MIGINEKCPKIREEVIPRHSLSVFLLNHKIKDEVESIEYPYCKDKPVICGVFFGNNWYGRQV